MQAPRAAIDAISMSPTPWNADPGVATSKTMNRSEGVGTNGITFPIMPRKKTRRRGLPAKRPATQAIQSYRKNMTLVQFLPIAMLEKLSEHRQLSQNRTP